MTPPPRCMKSTRNDWPSWQEMLIPVLWEDIPKDRPSYVKLCPGIATEACTRTRIFSIPRLVVGIVCLRPSKSSPPAPRLAAPTHYSSCSALDLATSLLSFDLQIRYKFSPPPPLHPGTLRCFSSVISTKSSSQMRRKCRPRLPFLPRCTAHCR